MKRATKRNLKAVPDYAESLAQVAQHVEAIISNPYCPVDLYEALSMYVSVKGNEKYEFVSVQCMFNDDWATRLSYLREGDAINSSGNMRW